MLLSLARLSAWRHMGCCNVPNYKTMACCVGLFTAEQPPPARLACIASTGSIQRRHVAAVLNPSLAKQATRIAKPLLASHQQAAIEVFAVLSLARRPSATAMPLLTSRHCTAYHGQTTKDKPSCFRIFLSLRASSWPFLRLRLDSSKGPCKTFFAWLSFSLPFLSCSQRRVALGT